MELVGLVLCYLGGILALAFVAVSLVTGLYYLADLIEEHPTTAKLYVQRIVQVLMGANGLLFVVDKAPLYCILPGVVAQGAILQLMRRFPFLSVNSPAFVVAAGATVGCHLAWAAHFSAQPVPHTLEYQVGFLAAMVWALPMVLLLALSVPHAVLPGASSGLPSTFYRAASHSTPCIAGGSPFVMQLRLARVSK